MKKTLIDDNWKFKRSEYDYALFFDEWVDRDIKSWITRNS